MHLFINKKRGIFINTSNRSNGKGFRIKYSNIQDVKVTYTSKAKITIFTKSGESVNLYLRKYETFLENLEKFMGDKKEEADEIPSDDDLSKLERLAKLHESGALTDEEFKKAKEKILG